MELFTYPTANDFLKETRQILELNEAANNLMLGSCQELLKRSGSNDTSPYFAAIKDNHENIVLIATMTLPRKVIVYDTPFPHTSDALEILVDSIFHYEPNLSTIIAKPRISRTFADIFSTMSGRIFQLHFERRTFELQKVIHPSNTEGRLQQATLDDVELVTHWNYAFAKEALGEDDLPKARESGILKN